MAKKNLLLVWGLLLLIAGVIGSFPAAASAQQGSTGPANFVFINYIGQDMVFDLDDVTYTIPGTATAPQGGRLELQLAPGEHKYAASIPGVGIGSAGTFVINSGGVVTKGARLEKTSALLDRNGNVLEKPRDYVFVFDATPAAAPAPQTAPVDTWQPVAAAPGQGSLAWTNYTSDELTVDLNGTLYKVPPSTVNSIPGHLQINVAPGQYNYTASVPNGSLNGQVTLTAGQVMGLNISAKLQPEPEYDVGEPPPSLKVELQLFQEDLTAKAVSQSVVTPAAAPASSEPVAPANPAAPTTPAGLLVKNYTGDTLIFTINNQAYSIADNSSMTLPLPPGNYNYTASLPFVATTGTVDLAADQGIELSVATNINHDVLSVYQN